MRRTLLDDTLVVWVTTLGQSRDHLLRDLPMVLAGGGGFLKTGRLLDAGGRSTSDVLVSALRG